MAALGTSCSPIKLQVGRCARPLPRTAVSSPRERCFLGDRVSVGVECISDGVIIDLCQGVPRFEVDHAIGGQMVCLLKFGDGLFGRLIIYARRTNSVKGIQGDGDGGEHNLDQHDRIGFFSALDHIARRREGVDGAL